MQVVDRSQNSVVKSLSELREMERQRIADEVSALQRAEAARIAARAEAERRAREEAEARERAEREAQLAIEHARLEAEREARRRIDAAAALELARQQLALEQARTEREHELRLEQVARTRPRWMVAITASALVAAGLLLWVALSSRAASIGAQELARLAEIERRQAIEDAEEAQKNLEGMRDDIEAHARTLESLREQILSAETQAERKALEAKLQQERQRQREREAQLRRIAEEKARQVRVRPIVISEECERNPFAPSCLPDGK